MKKILRRVLFCFARYVILTRTPFDKYQNALAITPEDLDYRARQMVRRWLREK